MFGRLSLSVESAGSVHLVVGLVIGAVCGCRPLCSSCRLQLKLRISEGLGMIVIYKGRRYHIYICVYIYG